MSNKKQHTKANWIVSILLVSLSIIFFIAVFFIHNFNESSTRINIRWSARLSLLCFSIAFSSSALFLLFPNGLTSWIKNNRKYFGVAFALIHLIHLGFLITLHYFFHKVFEIRGNAEIALGGLAYVFVVLMLLTSFKTFSSLVSSASWSKLHTLGSYWILLVFSNSIIGRVVSGKTEYTPLAILIIAVWLLRFVAWRRGAKMA